jgi:polyisoprenoid-binding protein YceI
MKSLLAAGAALVTLSSAMAAETLWVPDAAHTQVKFVVTYMVISEVSGTFKDFDFTVIQRGEDFRSASLEATVKTASVNTENEQRDNHLRSDDFFNAERYPEMKFLSTAFEKTGENTYKVTGNLTIRDVTLPVVLEAVYRGTVIDPWGNTKAGFKATGSIRRQDFGVKWNKTLDTGGLVVSDEVQIILDVQLKQVKKGTM